MEKKSNVKISIISLYNNVVIYNNLHNLFKNYGDYSRNIIIEKVYDTAIDSAQKSIYDNIDIENIIYYMLSELQLYSLNEYVLYDLIILLKDLIFLFRSQIFHIENIYKKSLYIKNITPSIVIIEHIKY